MEEALDILREEVWKEECGILHKSLKLDDTTTQDSIEREIEFLDETENARDMGRDILTLRAYLAQEKYAHQEAECNPFPIQYKNSRE